MTTTNRLATETSPYLRQHADNPVDWRPWGEEALAAAREGDRPILLSVGYSACHWCHVMAHECFEDPEVAAAMNAGFVNIKVDREERPDVDSIYMEAVQAISGGGGWPMTVFLLPDGRPFFGGTYFPKPQFLDLLGRVQTAWRDRRDGLESDAAQLAEAIARGARLPLAGEPAPEGADVVDRTVADLLERHDRDWGGFGGAPKFPQPTMLDLLLQAWAAAGTPDDDLGRAITTTLDAMASGGIYDHVGGGFARYATDQRWLVPHFEKMLYDNALLTRTYLHAWQLTGRDAYRQVVEETIGYLLSPPMRQPQGGFSSAEDADSEGEEGRFYVWDAAEVAEVGGPAALEWYRVEPGGNWEGHSILWRPVRGDLMRPPEVEAGRAALFARRQTRVRPGLDDKVLTEWNAMAVSALAEAGAAMGRDDWVVAAEEAASFLVLHLRRPDGRWLRTWSPPGEGSPGDGAGVLAYAGDHAWLIEAFSRLAEATGRAGWRLEAIRTADALLDLFWQPEGGGFATTGSDAPSLITRPMETYDGATPSANSTATRALLRLAALTGDARYQSAAEAVLDQMAAALAKAPTAFTGLVAAADLRRVGLTEVVITGDRPDLVAVLRDAYRPSVVLAWGEPDPTPLWEGRTDEGAAGLAYVCRHFACAAPTGEPAVLAAQLAATG